MIRSAYIHLLASLFFVACVAGESPPQDVSSPAAGSLRETLRGVKPSPQVQQAYDRLRAMDPDIEVTWLRGHIDAFTTKPKAAVPDYARRALARHGIQPQAIPVALAATVEPGETASAPVRPAHAVARRVDQDDEDDGTTWFAQVPETVAESVLAEFLAQHSQAFGVAPGAIRVPSSPSLDVPAATPSPAMPSFREAASDGHAGAPTAPPATPDHPAPAAGDASSGAAEIRHALPNLALANFGSGRHFRRAVFEQFVDDMPVLDGRLIVLFDMNWNVVAISRQLAARDRIPLDGQPKVEEAAAVDAAMAALAAHKGRSGDFRLLRAKLGIESVRGGYAWRVEIRDMRAQDRFTVRIDAVTGALLQLDDDTARFTDAQVKRWEYADGDRTAASRVVSTNIYTHDDNTLVHDFFYLVNDNRTNGTLTTCGSTPVDGKTAGAAYGTTTSATYVRPTIRNDRNFALWNPKGAKGTYGEGHVYYWARRYMQWQKQALVDLGVLTLGSFNNYTKALIVVNACSGGAGKFDSTFDVTTLDSHGEGLGTIILPERCRQGNSNCIASDYDDSNSSNLYTFEGNGGYHFVGVISHELNHFVLIDYFGVSNGLNCSIRKENKYYQEGGLGRTLAQMFWHHVYAVGYLPTTTNHLFRSDDISGRPHDPADATTLNEVSDYACGADAGNPYAWGGVVAQPMWKIYHGKKVSGTSLVNMARPAADLGMIKSMYYAADMAAASSFPDRFELANRFMEFWELFSTAVPTTKQDWCDVWGTHGLNTFITPSYCS